MVVVVVLLLQVVELQAGSGGREAVLMEVKEVMMGGTYHHCRS